MKAGRRPRFLAKDELFEIPVVGSAFRGAKQIPVVRGGAADRRRCDAAEEALADGEVVVIYPEGTVTKRPDHLPMDGQDRRGPALARDRACRSCRWRAGARRPCGRSPGTGSLKFGRPVWVRVGAPIDLSRRGATRSGDRRGAPAR